jgi:hypothetical protein
MTVSRPFAVELACRGAVQDHGQVSGRSNSSWAGWGRLIYDFDDYTYLAKRELGNVKIAKKFDGAIGRTVEACLRVKICVSSYLGSILEKSIRRFKAF